MTIAEIEKIVCAGENASPEILHDNTRRAAIIQVKYIVIRIAHEMGFSEYKIGEYFNRKHDDINYAKRTIMEQYQTNPELANKIDYYRMQVLHAKHSVKYDIPAIMDGLDKAIGKINHVKELIIS